MKTRKILEAKRKLQPLAKRRLPVKLGLAISYNLEEMRRVEQYVEETRIACLERNAKKDENGAPIREKQGSGEAYKLTDEGYQAFAEEYTNLLNEEVELEIRTIEEKVIEGIDEGRYDPLTAEDLSALLFMLS